MATHSLHPAPVSVATWRDRTATVLMFLAAVGACVAFVSSISTVAAAGPATQVVEIWRMYGFILTDRKREPHFSQKRNNTL